MEIKCYECGTENWLENQSRCLKCDTILRRCVDCSRYDRSHQLCDNFGSEVDLREAEHPSLLSPSTNCRDYLHAS